MYLCSEKGVQRENDFNVGHSLERKSKYRLEEKPLWYDILNSFDKSETMK